MTQGIFQKGLVNAILKGWKVWKAWDYDMFMSYVV